MKWKDIFNRKMELIRIIYYIPGYYPVKYDNMNLEIIASYLSFTEHRNIHVLIMRNTLMMLITFG